jgi:hypothetical protein
VETNCIKFNLSGIHDLLVLMSDKDVRFVRLNGPGPSGSSNSPSSHPIIRYTHSHSSGMHVGIGICIG